MGPRRRILLTVAGVVALLLAATALLDAPARARSSSVLRTALVTFASARALDAAISLAQGTEIAIQPAGLGMTLSAGELLDPINDLVEQFSSLMLVASTSLGLQGLLLAASAWWLLRALAVVALAARLTLLWRPDLLSADRTRLLQRLLVLLLLARFAMPVYALGTGWLFDRFLEPSRAEATAILDDAAAEVDSIEQLAEPPADAGEQGWMGRVSAWFGETMENLDVQGRIAAFRDRVAAVAEQIVHLIVVFVLQTIVLPLAFLWLLPRLASAALSRRA